MSTLLNGYKVLDFGRYIAAPYCGSLLGQMGAEVIRIERPGGSEDRYLLPISNSGEGAMYLQLNANKKGMTLDIAKEEGRAIAKRLISEADIVIANLPPDTLQKLGLDYESLKKINEEIILVANTAFGAEGPYANHIGFDGIAQAISGANFYSGLPDKPVRCTVNYIDYSTALSATIGTLMAIMEREKGRGGQVVGTSLLGTALTLNNAMLMEQAVLNRNRVPTGNRSQASGPSDLFKTKDGYIVLLVAGPYMFKRVCRLLNKLEWFEDPRFIDDNSRGDHREVLCEEMEKWTMQRTTAQALEELKVAKLPAGPVLNLADAMANPMVQALNHFVEQPLEDAAKAAPVAKAPIQLSKTPLLQPSPAPKLGEHTDEILKELGYQQRDIDAFKRNKII